MIQPMQLLRFREGPSIARSCSSTVLIVRCCVFSLQLCIARLSNVARVSVSGYIGIEVLTHWDPTELIDRLRAEMHASLSSLFLVAGCSDWYAGLWLEICKDFDRRILGDPLLKALQRIKRVSLSSTFSSLRLLNRNTDRIRSSG